MLHIGWFFILLHHHHHPPRCPARRPRTTSNLMCRLSLSLTLLANSIQRHSPDLMSNFSPILLMVKYDLKRLCATTLLVVMHISQHNPHLSSAVSQPNVR